MLATVVSSDCTPGETDDPVGRQHQMCIRDVHWQARERRCLQNLAGVDSPELEKILHPAMLRYLRDVRQFGMAARYQGPRSRQTSSPHPVSYIQLGAHETKGKCVCRLRVEEQHRDSRVKRIKGI